MTNPGPNQAGEEREREFFRAFCTLVQHARFNLDHGDASLAHSMCAELARLQDALTVQGTAFDRR